MLGIVILSFVVIAAAASVVFYVVRHAERAFERLEYIDWVRDEHNHPTTSEYVARVAMTLRRHGRAVRRVFVQRGPATLVLG